MHAMVLDFVGKSLRAAEIPVPEPGPEQVLLRVRACGVCRTDLHIVDGELPEHKSPLVPGHQIVGIVEEAGERVERFVAGDRVGVPWLGWTDDTCRYCRSGRENLCDAARFTGYDVDGGYAEYAVADYRFCLPIPDGYPDLQVAPLLCAGLIGYRSLRMAGDAERLGLYGFGAAAHTSPKSPYTRAERSMLSPAPEMKRPRASLGNSERRGPVARIRPHPRSSMPRSSSPPWEPWYRRRCGPLQRAAWWCAPAST